MNKRTTTKHIVYGKIKLTKFHKRQNSKGPINNKKKMPMKNQSNAK